MSLLVEVLPLRTTETVPDRLDGEGSADAAAFAFTIEHLGREYETVMGDVSLCCSCCCTCSSRQAPR